MLNSEDAWLEAQYEERFEFNGPWDEEYDEYEDPEEEDDAPEEDECLGHQVSNDHDPNHPVFSWAFCDGTCNRAPWLFED